jgi:hypothetical protein
LCDLHRREKERERSVERRGGYKRGPMTDVVAARDADPDYRYPKREDVRQKIKDHLDA